MRGGRLSLDFLGRIGFGLKHSFRIVVGFPAVGLGGTLARKAKWAVFLPDDDVIFTLSRKTPYQFFGVHITSFKFKVLLITFISLLVRPWS